MRGVNFCFFLCMNFFFRWFDTVVMGFARSAYDDGSLGRRYASRQSARPGIGCNPRLVMALLFIGGTLVYHWMSTTTYTNPFTGRVQKLAIADPKEEVAMGLQSMREMAREFGGEITGTRESAYVDQVGARLLGTTAVKETPYEFDFHLLADTRTVNAFALPGGQIFITKALFDLLQSEDQLAGVLGHEIGHVVGRHSNEQMAQGRLWQGLANGVGILLSDGNSNAGAQVAQYVAQMKVMSFGRNDELESDKLGVKFLIEAGYDPEALIGVMEILAKAGGGSKQPEFMSTHPNPENRIERIREEIGKQRGELAPR